MATHSSIVAWRIPMDRGAWRATVHGATVYSQSDMTEQVRTSQHMILCANYEHDIMFLSIKIQAVNKFFL